jgi:hypothetical protein
MEGTLMIWKCTCKSKKGGSIDISKVEEGKLMIWKCTCISKKGGSIDISKVEEGTLMIWKCTRKKRVVVLTFQRSRRVHS